MISWQQRFQIHGDQTHLSPIHFHQSCRRPLLLAHEPMVRSPSLFHSTRHFFTSSQDDGLRYALRAMRRLIATLSLLLTVTASAQNRVDRLLARMTIQEKLGQLTQLVEDEP